MLALIVCKQIMLPACGLTLIFKCDKNMRGIREAKNLADFNMVAKMFKAQTLKSQFVVAAKLRGLSNRLIHFTVSLHPPLYQSGGSHPDDDHSSGSGPEKKRTMMLIV